MNKKLIPVLDVKDLRISFKTNNGTVKAVRGISYTLYKGRTLAIVGESGSGKSVSSKAIMGLLAGNKIVEDGQILFDGKDLLKISEEDFVKIRGSRIAMIFQDPMSSLNPIMKVGHQITEVMILKNKSIIRYANKYISNFKKNTNKLVLDNATSNYDDALNYLIPSVKEAHKSYIDDLSNALNVISSLQKEIFANGFDLEISKKAYKEISKLLKNLYFKFETTKDNIIPTFSSELHNLNLRFSSNRITNERKAKKLEEINKKKEKGVNTENQELKLRSFSSEITLTDNDVANEINNAFSNVINYISKIINTPIEIEELAKEALDKYIESIKDKKDKLSKKEAKQRAISLLKEVGISSPENRYNQYPFELSGGMRQRVVIAIALASNPDVLICDEPTTALDVTIQAQILELINKIKKERHLSIIFITHNLGVVANMADDIAVMYAGKIVEYANAVDLFYDPRHPYTWALLASMPDLNTEERLHPIKGTPPNMILPPKGDSFAQRNEYALNIDFEKEPPLFKVGENHYAATWLVAPKAPKVEMPKIVKERINFLKEKNKEAFKDED